MTRLVLHEEEGFKVIAIHTQEQVDVMQRQAEAQHQQAQSVKWAKEVFDNQGKALPPPEESPVEEVKTVGFTPDMKLQRMGRRTRKRPVIHQVENPPTVTFQE